MTPLETIIANAVNARNMAMYSLTLILCSSLVIDSRVSPIANRKYIAVEALGYRTLLKRVKNRRIFSRMLYMNIYLKSFLALCTSLFLWLLPADSLLASLFSSPLILRPPIDDRPSRLLPSRLFWFEDAYFSKRGVLFDFLVVKGA